MFSGNEVIAFNNSFDADNSNNIDLLDEDGATTSTPISDKDVDLMQLLGVESTSPSKKRRTNWAANAEGQNDFVHVFCNTIALMLLWYTLVRWRRCRLGWMGGTSWWNIRWNGGRGGRVDEKRRGEAGQEERHQTRIGERRVPEGMVHRPPPGGGCVPRPGRGGGVQTSQGVGSSYGWWADAFKRKSRGKY